MRPVSLTVAGLRSYRAQRTLDFADRSLVAILGDTGSGKSSLLEALYGALYGASTWDARGLGALIADGVKTLQIQLVFTARGKTYTVSRATSRENYPPAKHVLDCLDDREHVDGQAAVNRRIQQIVGLSDQEFLRVVVLPQGRFGQLLQGTQGERTPILRGILGLGVLDRVRDVADRRAADLAAALEPLTAARHRLYPDPAAVAEAAHASEARHQLVFDRLSRAATLLAALDRATNAVEQSLPAVASALRQAAAVDLTDVLEALAQAEVAQADVDATEKRLCSERETHEQTAATRTGRLEDASRNGLTAASLAVAEAALESLIRTLPDLHRDARYQAEEGAALSAEATTLSEQGTTVAQARSEAVQAKSALAGLEAAASAAAEEVRKAQQQRTTLAEVVRLLVRRMDALGPAASGVLVAAEALRGARTQLSATGVNATAAIEELEGLRAANQAAHIASRHGPGEPCPVCARELPADFTAPPIMGEDALTAQVAATRAAWETATATERRAERDLDSARHQLMNGFHASVEAATRAAEAAETAGLLVAAVGRIDGDSAVSAKSRPTTADNLVDVVVSANGHEQQSAEAVEQAASGLAQRLRELATTDDAHLTTVDLNGPEATARLTDLTGREQAARATLAQAQDGASALAEAATAQAAELRGATERLTLRRTAHHQATERTTAAALRLAGQMAVLPAMLAGPLSDALGVTASDAVGALLAAPPLKATLTERLRADLGVRSRELDSWAEERETARRAVGAVDRLLAELGQQRKTTVDMPRTEGRSALERACGAVRSLRAALPGLDAAWDLLRSAADVPELPDRGPALTDDVSSACSDADLALTVAALAQRLSAAHATVDRTYSAANTSLDRARDGIDTALSEAGVASVAELNDQLSSANHQLREARSRHTRALAQQPVAAGLDEGLHALSVQLAVLQSVKELLSPSLFPSFVVAQRQTALLRIASSLLSTLTREGYGFGDDFMIVDRRTGQPRHAKTLSGGETFLASLALALALVEISNRSGGQLDCLFLDEGFGSLDSSILGEALDVLREQATNGRLVGVISHLHAVAAELDDVLVVTKGIDGSDFRWLDATERDRYLLDGADAGLLG